MVNKTLVQCHIYLLLFFLCYCVTPPPLTYRLKILIFFLHISCVHIIKINAHRKIIIDNSSVRI